MDPEIAAAYEQFLLEMMQSESGSWAILSPLWVCVPTLWWLTPTFDTSETRFIHDCIAYRVNWTGSFHGDTRRTKPCHRNGETLTAWLTSGTFLQFPVSCNIIITVVFSVTISFSQRLLSWRFMGILMNMSCQFACKTQFALVQLFSRH